MKGLDLLLWSQGYETIITTLLNNSSYGCYENKLLVEKKAALKTIYEWLNIE